MEAIKERDYAIKINAKGVSVLNISGLMPRSLVVFNGKNTAYNVVAKCRNTDRKSVLKCLVKVLLTAKRTLLEENSTEAVKKSSNKQSQSPLINRVLGCSYIGVTDKDGKVLTDSIIAFKDVTVTGRIRDVIKLNQNMELYKLVVTNGFAWEEPLVQNALGWYLAASLQHMEYLPKLDNALMALADGNEAADKKYDKLVKDATKVAIDQYNEVAQTMPQNKAIAVARAKVAEMVAGMDDETIAAVISAAMETLKGKLGKAEETAAA